MKGANIEVCCPISGDGATNEFQSKRGGFLFLSFLISISQNLLEKYLMMLYLLPMVKEIVFQTRTSLYMGKFLLVRLQCLIHVSKWKVHRSGEVEEVGKLNGFSLICSDFGVEPKNSDRKLDEFCWDVVL